jgi:dipeptidyl-peptidase-4
MTESFPRQYARTRGFNLGLPRAFTVAAGGSRVAFLRSRAGDDTTAALWVYDVGGDERVVFDPAGEDQITDAERDRRERARERQTGVVAYTTDPDLTIAAFAVGEALYVADLAPGASHPVRILTPAGPAFDPRPDPTGRRVAYVTDGALHVIDLATGGDLQLAADPDSHIHWGLAEFVAAEEMGRSCGYWWAPDGERILAARVDERSVGEWHIANPIDPAEAPRTVRYPQAGTANADVSLHVVGLDGSSTEARWDSEAFEYLVAASWMDEGPPLALVQSRDQRDVQVLGIDPDTGATETLWRDHDDRWTHIMAGVPAWLPGGRLLTSGRHDDTHALLIDGAPVTPPGLQVDAVIAAGDEIVFRATREPTEMHLWRRADDGGLTQLTHTPGVHAAVSRDDVTVVTTDTADDPLPTSILMRDGQPVHTFARFAETPMLTAKPTFVSLGPKELCAALLTPDGEEPDRPLPVLLDPYGGPHFGRVVRSQRMFLDSQWFADQGFVVLVTDGRGTPNRGVAWDQAVYRDYVDAALEDQVEALHAAAERYGYLDLSKVAMRGWSYGGYLTCAALLRRPDVFHAGIAGAPVTDLRFYDTHYTERYLGTPQGDPDAYAKADVVKDASNLRGELLLMHGIADDNVYVTHTLRLSKALMEAGRRHTMIPLSGITHRPIDEAAAENMLKIEVEFLRRALNVTPSQS